jgi:hypothetical protein
MTTQPPRLVQFARIPRLLATAALVIAVIAPASAAAREVVRLQTAFKPDRLGASTTIEFGVVVKNTDGRVPAPVTNIVVHTPAGMNRNVSELGLGVCEPNALMSEGPEACPHNSIVGLGTAFVETEVGGEVVQESASITTLFGPAKPGNDKVYEMLFYALAHTPVLSEIVFSGQMRWESDGEFGGVMETHVPLVPTWPEGPYVALTRFESTLGPDNLTYYVRNHGVVEAFHPRGIAVPTTCPRGGFPFAVELTFLDGTRASARSTVPCPGSRHARRH